MKPLKDLLGYLATLIKRGYIGISLYLETYGFCAYDLFTKSSMEARTVGHTAYYGYCNYVVMCSYVYMQDFANQVFPKFINLCTQCISSLVAKS